MFLILFRKNRLVHIPFRVVSYISASVLDHVWCLQRNGEFFSRLLLFFLQGTDEPNPTFNSIVSQVPDITTVGSNATINDSNLLNKLIAPNIASAQNYYTYKGSLTTPPCSEIVQWIDFIKPQTISHDQVSQKTLKMHSVNGFFWNESWVSEQVFSWKFVI